jgi:Tol biopolymer transport system component
MLKQLLLFVSITLLQRSFAQTPVLFTDNGISTERNERDMAISPDGHDMYYTLQTSRNILSTILHRTKVGNGWSKPEVAAFSGTFNDLEPAFSPDGKKLFFSSNRPSTGTQTKDYDIWVMERTGSGWSDPKNIGSPINTPANEFYPSIAQNGNLYFTAEKENAVGNEDIFVSRRNGDGYTQPVPLDTAVNSKLGEFNSFVAPDESYIIFSSYGRKDDAGGGDLYMSVNKNNQWQPAKNLRSINSATIDYCPFVYKGTLYFTSGRHSVISSRQSRMDYNALMKWYDSPVNGSENIYSVSINELKGN